MFVSEIWRYPVKSMGGEQLEAALLDVDGIEGDRIVHVRDGLGRLVTSRSKPRLLMHRATLGTAGEPMVDGRLWQDAAVTQDVITAAGAGAHLVKYRELDRFDVLPLLIATDGAIQLFGHDRRRLRPNIIVGGVVGLAERDWEHHGLKIGDCLIQIADLRARCIMTTFDPDTVEQDVEVLKDIHRDFGGKLALNCNVLRGGRIAVGDSCELVPTR